MVDEKPVTLPAGRQGAEARQPGGQAKNDLETQNFRDSVARLPVGQVASKPSKGKQIIDNSTESEDNLFKKIKKAWPKILKDVRGKNNSLEMFLKGSVPDKVEDDTLFLKFYYRFHKERVEESKNRAIIEEIIEKEVDKPVRIKGVMGERPATLPAGRQGTEARKVKKAQKKDEVDPAEIFGKIE